MVWGMARARGGSVLLRIEDHDRRRSRLGYEAALLADLAWLGFRPDEGPVRQSADDRPYRAALEQLRDRGLIYGCDCSRSTFAGWADGIGRPWSGTGCPGDCRNRGADEVTLRAALGDGGESWADALAGERDSIVASAGDPLIRDREANWTYGFAVVVDDMRQGIDLVIRGEDLLEATPAQIRLARLLGRERPPTFAHHRLVWRGDGLKLSKAEGDTAIAQLRADGRSAAQVIGDAAARIGLQRFPRPIRAEEVVSLFA